MAASNGQLAMVPLAKIKDNPVALRQVDKTKEAYSELVDSIRLKGILNPILVREMKEPGSDETFYAVIDGLHRFTASVDAGLKEIPAYIRNLQESELKRAVSMVTC